MRRWDSVIAAGWVLVAGALVWGQVRPPLKDALALEEAMMQAIARAEPAIACILVSRSEKQLGRSRFDAEEIAPESYGSGVVIGAKGLVLTNYHVVRDCTRLTVRLPGRKECLAEIFAADPRSDLAVLRLENSIAVAFPTIKLGDGDQVRKGQFVLSIANPFAAGFQDGSPSASWGIISNIRRRAPGKPPLTELDRTRTTLHHFGTLLQIDARLNLGCSGGALIDLRGEMIGMTTALAALTGTETSGGFAVPMTAGMKKIIGVLKEGKEVEYGFLGITFNPVTGGDGVSVGHVIPGSPAFQAGVRDNDTILQVNGQPVTTNDDLLLAIGSLLAGGDAHLTLLSTRRAVTVHLSKYYLPGPSIVSTKPAFAKGLRVDYTSVLSQQVGALNSIPPGVFVKEVQPGSQAEAEKLEQAIITHVNEKAVNEPDDFYREMKNQSGPVEVTYWRQEETGLPKKIKLP